MTQLSLALVSQWSYTAHVLRSMQKNSIARTNQVKKAQSQTHGKKTTNPLNPTQSI
jgi:hypothetical protein